MTGALEIKVLAIVLTRKCYLRYKELIRPEFFKSLELRMIYKAIGKLHEKFKRKRVLIKQVWLTLEKQIDEDDVELFRKLLLKVKRENVDDEDIIEFTLTKFAQESILKNSIGNVMQQLDSGTEVNLDKLKIEVDHIVSLNGKQSNEVYKYMDEHKDRVDVKSEPPKVPTGISIQLDRSLNGGIAEGELGFVLAPPGRGKTLALVNIGATGLKLGKRVLHVTLEIKARIVAKRYDCCLTQSRFEDIREQPKRLEKRLEKLKGLGAELNIQDYSYSHCGISELNSLIERMKDLNKMPDILIIDYADLMVPPQNYKDSRHEVTKIFEELRILAGHYKIPVWTASQANRASLSRRIIGLESIAEAFAKANIADLVLALCQTEDEKDEKDMRIFVAKSRMGSTNPVIPVMCDPDRMILKARRSWDAGDTSSRSRTDAIKRSLNRQKTRSVSGIKKPSS